LCSFFLEHLVSLSSPRRRRRRRRHDIVFLVRLMLHIVSGHCIWKYIISQYKMENDFEISLIIHNLFSKLNKTFDHDVIFD